MKVCKKCKRQVTNKTKICKHCGADVSKCKIIVNKKNTQQSHPKNQIKKTNKLETQKITNPKNNIQNETKQINIQEVKKELNNVELEKTKIYKLPVKVNKEIKPNANANENKILQIVKNIKNIIKSKKSITIIAIVLVLLSSTYIAYEYYFDDDSKVVLGEKATNEKLFNINEMITYKGVNYEVVKVETSEGNSYKSPKEGNIFLIVTIKIENNTPSKINYSYKNWTMSNSTQEEEKRIFTSINVGNALYSGKLVVGGIKTGSMVFEQPKDDNKLKLNYYELKTEKGEEDIDKEKKVFSVSIKIPKKQEEQESTPKKQEGKVVKTMAKTNKTKNLKRKS